MKGWTIRMMMAGVWVWMGCVALPEAEAQFGRRSSMGDRTPLVTTPERAEETAEDAPRQEAPQQTAEPVEIDPLERLDERLHRVERSVDRDYEGDNLTRLEFRLRQMEQRLERMEQELRRMEDRLRQAELRR